MNNLDTQYIQLVKDILYQGILKSDRTGTGTLSVFGRQIRHKMSEGFPLLTTKSVPFKTMVTELLWFLKGRTDLRYLLENGCNIWAGDSYKNYVTKQPKSKVGDYENYIDCYCGHTDTCDCGPMYEKEFIEKIKTDDEFAEKWGSLGEVYGAQWRNWNGNVDQIVNLVNDLQTNPDSRRLLVNSWNVDELDQMVLPPCHYSFQVYTRELSREERWDLLKRRVDIEQFAEMANDIIPFGGGLNEVIQSLNIPKRAISLMFNMRSTDVGLGLPFNLASYGLLLMFIGRYVNMVPDQLIYSGGDIHIYTNHIEPIKEQLDREPFELPKVEFIEGLFDRTYPDSEVKLDLDSLIKSLSPSDFILHNYKSHPTIKLPLSN